jgi:hypothetical protein
VSELNWNRCPNSPGIRSTHKPTLTVTFLTITNVEVFRIARFAITNVGKATVVSYGVGEIEMFGHQPLSYPDYRGAIRRLSPGQGIVVAVGLPNRVHSPWRWTCLCAHDGLRCRIDDWRWGAKGLGSVERFIPSFLDLRVPLRVGGTSDWIEK